MKVQLIKDYSEKYKRYLETDDSQSNHYKYESLNNFRNQWELSDLDLHTTFDRSFKSTISNVLWGGSVTSAKSMMLLFIQKNKEFCRSMYRDLFDDGKDLAMRISRFNFHCDQMLDELKSSPEKYNNHFQDPSIVSLYLCFNNPATYCIINHKEFSQMLTKLEAKNVPQYYELHRSLNLCKGLYTILSKDQDLVELYQSKIPKEHKTELNMLLVHDFYTTCYKL